jgi:Tetratricopeptide repeat
LVSFSSIFIFLVNVFGNVPIREVLKEEVPMKRLCWMLPLLLWSEPQTLWAKGKPTPSSQPVGNKDMERARALFDQGEVFFKLGQYEKAAAAYQEAYLLSKAPLFLLNIGQCYTNLGQTKEAIHSYEAFIREDPKSPYRAEIEGQIDDLKAYLAQKQNESASLPVIMVAPVEKTLNKKRVLFASAGGAALLGVGLTFFFIYRPPSSDGGAQPVTFRGVP